MCAIVLGESMSDSCTLPQMSALLSYRIVVVSFFSRKSAPTFGVFTEPTLEFIQHGLEVFGVCINSFAAQFADAIFSAARGQRGGYCFSR